MGVQERVAVLEGRVSELSRTFEAIQAQMRGFEERMDRRFAAVDARFASIDLRLDAVDRRFEGLDRRLEALDSKVSRQFTWLVGLMVMMMTAVIGAFIAR